MEELEEFHPKKKIIFKIGLFLLLLIGLLLSYMYFVEPKLLTTNEYAIIDENLPSSFNGFKIAHFSDIHFGRTINEHEMQKVVQKLNEMKPDIVVFTGDLFDSYITLSEDNKIFLKEELNKITSNIGKFAVMGDNDYLDENAYKEIMKSSGFTILENSNIPIFYQGSIPIYLGGVPSVSKGIQDYTKALTKDLEGSYYQIFLSHEPISFSSVKSFSNLVLTGHTLGGLVHIPFVGGIVKKNNVGEYLNGKYVNGSSTMFVSNGIGTEDISLRFLNTPSINLYRLYNYE